MSRDWGIVRPIYGFLIQNVICFWKNKGVYESSYCPLIEDSIVRVFDNWNTTKVVGSESQPADWSPFFDFKVLARKESQNLRWFRMELCVLREASVSSAQFMEMINRALVWMKSGHLIHRQPLCKFLWLLYDFGRDEIFLIRLFTGMSTMVGSWSFESMLFSVATPLKTRRSFSTVNDFKLSGRCDRPKNLGAFLGRNLCSRHLYERASGERE